MTISQYLKIKLIRLFNYEYWPYLFFYSPMYFYGLYLAFRSRSFTYFTTANPSMKYGGVMGESKYKILQSIPEQYRPKTLFIENGIFEKEILITMDQTGLKFPLIAKPDVGERGTGVEKINSVAEWKLYHQQHRKNYILQEFIPYQHELGVLYYRHPGEEKGHISSIVLKKFLCLKGDGQHTVEQLLNKNIRAYTRLKYLKNRFSGRLTYVLEKGEEILLEPIGNHSRGTTFLNGNHLINSKLENVFNAISLHIPGFNYGRFDIKVESLQNMYEGKNIHILELNGVSSEPAHIYDPDYRLLNAYRDIARHMRVIYRISKANYNSGYRRDSLIEFLGDLKKHFSRKKNESPLPG